jgi:diguanylate cyclase (GGDEF)-like protein/PAS domain S-box-containing protein
VSRARPLPTTVAMPAYPRRSHALILSATGGAGILLITMGWPDADRAIWLGGLVIAASIASLPPVETASRDWPGLRLAFVAEFMSLLTLGPHFAMLVAASSIVSREAGNASPSRTWRQRAASAASILVALQAAGWLYAVAGGTVRTFDWPMQAAPIAAAILVYCIICGAFCFVLAGSDVRRPGLSDPANLSGRRPGLSDPANLSVRRPGLSDPANLSDAASLKTLPACILQECPVHIVAASVAAGLVEAIVLRNWAVLAIALVPLYLAFRVYAVHADRLAEERERGQSLASRVAALSNDVTEKTRTVQALQRKGERLALAAEVANDGLWEWDLAGGRLYVTGRWKAMIGLPEDAAITKPEEWLDRVHAEDIGPLKEALDAHLADRAERFQHEHRIRHEDGTYRFFQCRGIASRLGKRPTHIAGSLTDTTDLAITQQRLRDAVYTDPLTGLYNRAVFVEGLGRRLKESQRRRGMDPFALLYLDLDRFKIVNDSLGHLVGDELLVAVSRRLETCLRQGDVLARLGGDEFAILVNGLQSDQHANVIAIRVQQALSKPFQIGGREVFTSASIGIAFGGAQYNNPDEMMHDADTAMYQAKARGKARHEVFDADMDARARDRLELENDLRRAVDAADFEVHYQPIVSLTTGMCVGFESLVRWTRNGKAISPATFIPMAEELGLIDRIGTRVLEEACRTFSGWQRAFPDAGLDCITVNVSSRQLMQPNFLSVVDRAVRQAGLATSALRIEITETALMTNPEEAATVLSALRKFGVKIYLDDFGTGYSSLSHLHNLPVDALKIDRSFVRSLLLPGRPAIVESILALARTLHTSVVAEGIETEVQARELERLGCTHAQGYLFSRPVSASAVQEILIARRPLGPKGGQPVYVLAHAQPAG